MRGSIIKTKKKQWREGIALDDANFQSDFADLLLRPVRKPDLQSRHHLNDEALDTEGKAIRVKELLQEGVVDVVIRLLEVVISLHHFILLLLPHRVRGKVFDDNLLASL